MSLISQHWKLSLLIFILYFLPTIISFFNKKCKSIPIFLVNLFWGWTIFVWFSMLIEAFSDPSIYRTGYDDRNLNNLKPLKDDDLDLYIGVSNTNGIWWIQLRSATLNN